MSENVKPVVALLVLTNMIMFGVMVWHTGEIFVFPESEYMNDLAAIPQCFVECDVRSIDAPPLFVTLFSSMFLHGGIIHVAGNMVFLASVGGILEERWGKGKFFLLYILMGLAATGAYVALNIESPIPLVGASGAIAGLLGSVVVLFPSRRTVTFAAFWLIVYNILPLLGFGLAFLIVGTKNIAYEAHIGGFVAGVIIGIMFRLASRGAGRNSDKNYE